MSKLNNETRGMMTALITSRQSSDDLVTEETWKQFKKTFDESIKLSNIYNDMMVEYLDDPTLQHQCFNDYVLNYYGVIIEHTPLGGIAFMKEANDRYHWFLLKYMS